MEAPAVEAPAVEAPADGAPADGARADGAPADGAPADEAERGSELGDDTGSEGSIPETPPWHRMPVCNSLCVSLLDD